MMPVTTEDATPVLGGDGWVALPFRMADPLRQNSHLGVAGASRLAAARRRPEPRVRIGLHTTGTPKCTGSVYRARYYNPTTARFLSEDPVGFAGSGPNLYEYADGNPVQFRDPSGKYIWVLAGAAIGAGVNLTATIIQNGGLNGLTSQQLLAAGLGGAVAGGLGALAGPLGGTLALELGLGTSSGAAAIGATGLLSGVASAVGQELSNLIDPCHQGSVASAALFGGLGGGLGKALPTNTLNTLSQASYFGGNSLNALFGSSNAWWNTGATALSNVVGSLTGLAPSSSSSGRQCGCN